MNTGQMQIQMQRPATRARVIEFPQVEEIIKLEISIEARLRELTNFVEDFGDAAFNLFLTEKEAVREAIEELAVKVSALNWIVRVAKRSTGLVREGLWADIERALTDLEKTAHAVMRATEKWNHADLGAHREQAVCVERV
jgi:hypothetical protein